MKKRWRVYFNRRENFPCVWSIDNGDASTEINVQGVMFADIANVLSVYKSDAVPCAWFELEARMIVQGGMAVFFAGELNGN